MAWTVDCSQLERIEAHQNAMNAVKRLELKSMPQLKDVSFTGCAAVGLEEIEVKEDPLLASFFIDRCAESIKTIDLDSDGGRGV